MAKKRLLSSRDTRYSGEEGLALDLILSRKEYLMDLCGGHAYSGLVRGGVT